jgi:hypothetical protein
MYSRRPKCGYVRQPTDRCDRNRCPGCGLVFTKWLKRRLSGPADASRERELGSPLLIVAKRRLLEVQNTEFNGILHSGHNIRGFLPMGLATHLAG